MFIPCKDPTVYSVSVANPNSLHLGSLLINGRKRCHSCSYKCNPDLWAGWHWLLSDILTLFHILLFGSTICSAALAFPLLGFSAGFGQLLALSPLDELVAG
jgi:hypothetical protein